MKSAGSVSRRSCKRKDLLLGSPYAFTARGPKALKGVPGEWEIYAVEPAAL